jgi:predicted AlkP superfamily phosphohydrolase/phosphomutase
MRDKKVFEILFDGAPFDVLFPLAQEGILPTMNKILKKGSFNLLKSTLPPISPVAIPSLVTGQDPGKHGLFGFGYLENGRFKPFTSKNISSNAIWDILSSVKKKSILLNIPLTYPAFEVNGVMISGPPSPGNRIDTYPPDLMSVIKSEIGEYKVDIDIKKLDYKGINETEFINEAYRVTKIREKTMHYLMQNYEWDLFLAGFTTLDRMQHVFYGYYDRESPFYNEEKRNVLLEYYQELDDILERTISLLNDEVLLFIVSDHGFEYIKKYVGLNNLLVKGKFVKIRSKSEFFSIEKITSILQKIGLGYLKKALPYKVSNLIENIFPRKLDYDNSDCFAFAGNKIYINDKYKLNIDKYEFIKQKIINDKYKLNIDKYEFIKQKIISYLYSIEDPESKEKIVEKIYHKNDIYKGNLENVPDLLVILKKGYSTKTWGNNIFEKIKINENETNYTATHHNFYSQRGIFMSLGSEIKNVINLKFDIMDITPTILYILGVPILNNLDGTITHQIFKDDVIFKEVKIKSKEKSHDIYKEDDLTEEDNEAIIERLKKLGYIQ